MTWNRTSGSRPLDGAGSLGQGSRVIGEAYRRSGATRWSVSEAELTVAIERARTSRFADRPPSPRDESAWIDKLHVEDLALARACELERDEAWRHFMTIHRPALYRAARALTGNESQARELADTLWVDLYGLKEQGGERRSLLAYYHGRSSLGGWLRAVLSQRHVDAKRAERRTRPLEDGAARRIPDPRPGVESHDPDRSRLLGILRKVLQTVLAALNPEDRLRLSLYYVEEQTLAAIGQLFREHESTVSRKLDRVRRSLRRDVERSLRKDHALDADQVRACFEHATGDWAFDLRRSIEAQEVASSSFSGGKEVT